MLSVATHRKGRSTCTSSWTQSRQNSSRVRLPEKEGGGNQKQSWRSPEKEGDGNQKQSEAIRSNQKQSEAIRSNQKQSGRLPEKESDGNEKKSEAIRSNQGDCLRNEKEGGGRTQARARSAAAEDEEGRASVHAAIAPCARHFAPSVPPASHHPSEVGNQWPSAAISTSGPLSPSPVRSVISGHQLQSVRVARSHRPQ